MTENEYHLVYHDKKGNLFEHQVKIRKARYCISFNGICDDIKEYKLISLGNGEHYWDEIIGYYPYPEGSEFVIDFRHEISIPAKEMNKIIEFFKDKWE